MYLVYAVRGFQLAGDSHPPNVLTEHVGVVKYSDFDLMNSIISFSFNLCI